MTYDEAHAWLHGVQRFGVKLGLENARRLFAALDVTKLDARVVHVAGTNGKGSTCAMAAAICQAQGYRTGLFTSPHLITFCERIRVNGEMIEKHDVALGLSAIRELVTSWDPHPTFFEITTALALLHFKQQRCETVVLETGMGGRLDATNASEPAVCAITPIDFDHQAWLGSTLEQIATEKAGIIKPHVPVVSAPQHTDAERVIRHRADECEAPLRFISEPLRDVRLALDGKHQMENAALAVAALNDGKIEIDQAAIAKGLESVDWPARFQRIDKHIVVDGAHNIAGARVLVATWREQFANQRAVVVAGMLSDKDATSFWQILAPIAAHVVLPPFQCDRAIPPTELRAIIDSVTDADVTIATSVADAIRSAEKCAAPILITGSLHFAGEVLAILRGEPAAFENCSQ
ncbi:MAG: bifunctional folylpolyglutamate synthase/dihydrofolate synthase [Chthoniobacterales bacterium]